MTATRKRLSTIGNSPGIVIDKPILELLDIDRETNLDLTTDGQRLIIEPVRQLRRRVVAAAKRVMGAHGATLRGGHGVSDQQARQVLECRSMKVAYDSKTDTLTVIFRDRVTIAESDEEKPGVILDYDGNGNLVSLEILDASLRVTDTRKVEVQMTG